MTDYQPRGTITRWEFVWNCRRYRGVPWRHQGRSVSGLDCVGLIFQSARDLWLPVEDALPYPRRPDGSFLDRFRERLREIAPADARLGDVLVFSEGSHPCHCGVLAERHMRPSLIHAHARRRVVVEEPLEQAQADIGRPLHAFQLPNLEG